MKKEEDIAVRDWDENTMTSICIRSPHMMSASIVAKDFHSIIQPHIAMSAIPQAGRLAGKVAIVTGMHLFPVSPVSHH